MPFINIAFPFIGFPERNNTFMLKNNVKTWQYELLSCGGDANNSTKNYNIGKRYNKEKMLNGASQLC